MIYISFKLRFCHSLPESRKEFGDHLKRLYHPYKNEKERSWNLPYNLYGEDYKDRESYRHCYWIHKRLIGNTQRESVTNLGILQFLVEGSRRFHWQTPLKTSINI